MIAWVLIATEKKNDCGRVLLKLFRVLEQGENIPENGEKKVTQAGVCTDARFSGEKMQVSELSPSLSHSLSPNKVRARGERKESENPKKNRKEQNFLLFIFSIINLALHTCVRHTLTLSHTSHALSAWGVQRLQREK